MKHFAAILLLAAMCFCLVSSALAEDFDFTKILDWYEQDENFGTWMTTLGDHWNRDIATAPTDEEIEKMLHFAMKAPTGDHWTETFFLVVRDPAAQQGIIGESFGTLEGCANEGTVTILILVDNILPQEEHLSDYSQVVLAPGAEMACFNSGLTCGMLNVAANAMGYSTHYFFVPHGELIKGPERDPSYFLSGNDYTRLWGAFQPYGDESGCLELPVEGNVKMLGAVVIGTPNKDEDARTSATMFVRPDNFAFWD